MSIWQKLWRVALGIAIGAAGCVLGFLLSQNPHMPYQFMGVAVAVIAAYLGVATMSTVLPGKLK